jgi:hypothetical protein
MPPSSQIFVRVSLTKSSQRFLDALSDLMGAIEHADTALLEDRIGAAHVELVAALRDLDAIGFSTDQ